MLSPPRMPSADGRRLYYATQDAVMAVDVNATGRGFSAGVPRPVTSEQVPRKGSAHTGWDLARDGRLLVTRPSGDGGRPTYVHVVQNWLQNLPNRTTP